MGARETEWPEELAPPRRRWAIVTIWLAIGMSVLDTSLIVVALPSISRQLGVTAAESTFVINAFQIAVLISLLPLSAIGERIGCRRVYLSGLGLFVLGSLACTLVGNLTMLILARFVQGIGSAAIQAMNAPMLRYTYPRDRLGRGIGYNTLIISIMSAMGPTLAASLLALGSWNLLFLLQIPLGLLALAIGLRNLPATPATDRRLDIMAMLLNVVTLAAFFVAASYLVRSEICIEAAGAALVGVVAAWAWVRRSRNAAAPFLPVDLLRLRPLRRSYSMSALIWAGQVGTMMSVPFYLQGKLGLDLLHIGAVITPWPVAVAITAPIAGHMVERVSANRLCIIGSALGCAGLISIAMLPLGAPLVFIGAALACSGAGFALFQTPNNRSMLQGAPHDRSGAAGGMLAVARLFGQIGGSVAVALIFVVCGSASAVPLVVASGCFALAMVIGMRAPRDGSGETAIHP
jgi:DHA2 family multidrug resistance protein-like MFS transporter